jgi:hypothetical protein
MIAHFHPPPPHPPPQAGEGADRVCRELISISEEAFSRCRNLEVTGQIRAPRESSLACGDQSVLPAR